jgi:hypothetical protein
MSQSWLSMANESRISREMTENIDLPIQSMKASQRFVMSGEKKYPLMARQRISAHQP